MEGFDPNNNDFHLILAILAMGCIKITYFLLCTSLKKFWMGQTAILVAIALLFTGIFAFERQKELHDKKMWAIAKGYHDPAIGSNMRNCLLHADYRERIHSENRSQALEKCINDGLQDGRFVDVDPNNLPDKDTPVYRIKYK